MILKIRVRPNSGKQNVEKIKDNEYKVNLKQNAEDNKANIELLKLLKEHFKAGSNNIKIIKGLKSRKKVVEVKD